MAPSNHVSAAEWGAELGTKQTRDPALGRSVILSPALTLRGHTANPGQKEAANSS